MSLKQDIALSRKPGLPVVFLGGECSDDNAWRKEIKNSFKSRAMFLDPYKSDWDPEEDIYNELAGVIVSDFVVFYKGGNGSKKEKQFLDTVGRPLYEEFEELPALSAYLESKLPAESAASVAVKVAMKRITL